MGLYCTVSEINGDFSQKSQFSHPCVFLRPAEGVPLELGIGTRVQKTRMMGLPCRERSLDTIHERDGRTDTGRQQRPRLRIASRGKNHAMLLK